VRRICIGSFGWCTSLATIAIPKGCRLHDEAFEQCNPRVMIL
jgi:hypothetical protein